MLQSQMRSLVIIIAAALATFSAEAMEANSPGMKFSRDAFISSYMDAVRQNPKIALSQLAYLFAVTGNNSQDRSEFETAAASIPFNEQLAKIGSYLPQVGLGVGLSSPLGSLSASYDLNPLIASVFRGISKMMSPEEVEKTIQSIAYMNPSFIAALGRLTWDAWNNTGELRNLHSMYGIISQYTAQVPSPDAPPSAYIEIASPFVTPFYHQINIQAGSVPIAAREKWDVFLQNLPKYSSFKTDSQYGTQAVHDAAERIASVRTPARISFVLSAFGRPSTGASFSLDRDLDNRIRHWFYEKAKVDALEKRSFSEIRADWMEVHGLLQQAAAIAFALQDNGSQRAVFITEQMVKLTYSVEMLNSAETSLQNATAAFSVVGAVASLFNMLDQATSPQKPSPEVLLLDGQKRILEALSQVSAQVHGVAVTLACVQRQISLLQFAISTDFAIARKELQAVQSSLAANKAELLNALSNSILAPSLHAAEALQSQAQTREIVAALKRRDPQALQLFFTSIAILTSDIARLPFESPFLSPTTLSDATPDHVLERPWDFTKAVVDHVIQSADYYEIQSATSPSAKAPSSNIPESAKSSLRTLQEIMSQEKRNVFLNLDTFHVLLSLLTDTSLRFPNNIPVPLEVARINRNQQRFDAILTAIVKSEPIVNYSLRADLAQLQKHWDTFALSILNDLYPISGAGGLSDRQLLNEMISTPVSGFVESIDCAVDPDRKCSFQDQSGARQKLIGMNLIQPEQEYLFYDTKGSGIPFNYRHQPINACAYVARVHHWTSFAVAEYENIVKKSPDGLLTNYRRVCATSIIAAGDPDWINFNSQRSYKEWQKIAPSLIKRIHDSHLRGAILDQRATFTEVAIEGEHRKRLESSAAAATALAGAELARANRKFHERSAVDSKAIGDFKASLEDVLKDTVALQFIALLSRPLCYKATWVAQLSHLFSMDGVGRLTFLAKQALLDLTSGNFQTIGIKVKELMNAGLLRYIQAETECYLAPARMSDSVELIEILRHRQQL